MDLMKNIFIVFVYIVFKKYIYKDMTRAKCEQLSFVIIGISILLSSYKLLRKCKIQINNKYNFIINNLI